MCHCWWTIIMDSQSIITQANRDESCTEFPILSLPRPVPPSQNSSAPGLLQSCIWILTPLIPADQYRNGLGKDKAFVNFFLWNCTNFSRKVFCQVPIKECRHLCLWQLANMMLELTVTFPVIGQQGITCCPATSINLYCLLMGICVNNLTNIVKL